MSASDYPDHLNPFSEGETKKSGLHIGHSFKEFRKTLRQSFRTKKKAKEDVQLRKHEPYDPRHALSLDGYRPPIILNYENVTTPALPRSRFKERLAMSYCHGADGHGPPNPFEESSGLRDEVKVRAPRRKKRAPLPPKSSSSQSINEEEPFDDKNDSKWSLTSLETVSTENLSDLACSRDLDISSELQIFTKEMEKLNDGDIEANEIHRSEETKGSNSITNIPDVVVSCVDDELVCNGSPIRDANENEHARDSIDDSCDRDGKAGLDETINMEANIEDSCITVEPSHANIQTNRREGCESTESNNGPGTDDKEKLDNTSGSSNESLIVIDITQNLKNTEEAEAVSVFETDETKGTVTQEVTNDAETSNEDTTQEGSQDVAVDNTDDHEAPISYNERKSIYINGSREELNTKNDVYSEKVSLYITGSQDNLDKDNNNDLVDNKNITSSSPVPTPKQRKAKLSKNELLLGHKNCD